jgi:hypothetical protein
MKEDGEEKNAFAGREERVLGFSRLVRKQKRDKNE